jgi:hypothetical protein
LWERAIEEGAPAAETEQDVEEEIADEEEEDYSILIPSKPNHLDFEKSAISEADMPMMMKLGYFGEAEKKLIRFAREETTLTPKDDEVVVFKSFFRAGLRFPLNEIIGEILDNYEIFLHQLTPNAIVRLSIFIWALRSQGMDPNAEAFCRVHELHYQTKAREDGLHENFGCYNFAYRKDTKASILSYQTKWPTAWKSEWFYIKDDEKKREKLKMLVMSPLSLSFGMTRLLCNMKPGLPCQLAVAEFRVVVEHVSTRDLVQEYLANIEWMEYAEAERNKEGWTCLIALSFQVWETIQRALPGMARNDWDYVQQNSRQLYEKRRSTDDCSLRHPNKTVGEENLWPGGGSHPP